MAKPHPQPRRHPFNHSRHKNIYPMKNSLGRGYAVRLPSGNPTKKANGRFINILGEYIDLYIEDIQSDFSMAGSTGQSRTLRQFFPHNMVQPSIQVTGISTNSHHYNKLAAFIRVSQHLALAGQRLRESDIPFRNILDANGHVVAIPTIRFLISNGTKDFDIPRHGRTIKGIHKPWRLEGYVKSMAAGAERFQQAPRFAFEFLIAQSQSGIWHDHAVVGDQIRSWMQIFRGGGKHGFIRPGDPHPDNHNPGHHPGHNHHHHHGGPPNPNWAGP